MKRIMNDKKINYSIKDKHEKASQFPERLLINMATTYSPAFWCSTIGHEGLNCFITNFTLPQRNALAINLFIKPTSHILQITSLLFFQTTDVSEFHKCYHIYNLFYNNANT